MIFQSAQHRDKNKIINVYGGNTIDEESVIGVQGLCKGACAVRDGHHHSALQCGKAGQDGAFRGRAGNPFGP